jgi:maleate cis-trans isomerase
MPYQKIIARGADMYGWRGKIGHISPSRGDIFVHEFYQMAPKGVLLFNTTGTIRQLDRANMEHQLTRIEEAAADLAQEGMDLIMIGGTPLFTSQGAGSDIRIAHHIQEKVHTPVTAGVTGEIAALKELGIKKLIVASPHEPELDAVLKVFLEYSGFQVVHTGGLGIKLNADISKLPEHASYRLAKKLFFEAPEHADGVFIPCPRWPTIGNIELLEQELGCPVITSSQAYCWWGLKLLHIRENITGYGQLMRTLA